MLRPSITQVGSVTVFPDGSIHLEGWSFDASNLIEDDLPMPALCEHTEEGTFYAGWQIEELQRIAEDDDAILLATPEDFT